MKKIPYGRQSISREDVAAVVRALESDYLTQGPAISDFEAAVANYCGAKYAVAVSSATAALHLSVLALGLKENGTLWTSPNTFVASANCARYVGAKVDFVDINSDDLNLSVIHLEEKLLSQAAPTILVPVHHSGRSCDMRRIHALAKKYNFAVVEDASHAIGASYGHSKVGACEYSDITVFSFHPVKIVTTGEGGMLLTNRDDLYEKLIRLRTHGITRDPMKMHLAKGEPWYYEQVDLGFNYRMTDIQAALGLSQLKQLDDFVDRRLQIAGRYDRELVGLPLFTPPTTKDGISANHLYPIRLKLSELKNTRLEIYENLHAAGVLVNVHYIPVHLQPYYQSLGFKRGQFPNAESYYEAALSIPMFPALSHQDQTYVIETLKRAVS